MAMKRSRLAATLVEVLMALAVGIIAIAAILMIFLSVRKMEHAGDLSGALQEAALAMATIQKDLVQAVQKPLPGVTSAVLPTSDGWCMIRGVMKPDGSIEGTPVQYRRVYTQQQNYRIERKIGTDLHTLPGLYRNVDFKGLKGAGHPFVRVTLHLATHDVKIAPGKAKGSEEAVLSSLVRIQGPEGAGSSTFPFLFMKLLGIGFPFNLF
jgi:type II secretory pathway pseudopilin PulG